MKQKFIGQANYRRRMRVNQMRRLVRRNLININNFRILLQMGSIIAILYACYYTIHLPHWRIDPKMLDVAAPEVIKIEDNKIVPTTKIVDVVRQTRLPDVPVYKLDTTLLRDNILKLEPIDKVFIRRYWAPARIHIGVIEKTPVLSISPSIDVAPIGVVAEDGRYIGRDYMPLSKEYETISVLSYGTRGDDYMQWDSKRVSDIRTLARILETLSRQKVEYIDLRTPQDVYVKLEKVMVRMGEINATVHSRAKNIASIMPQINNLDKKIKYIDLRWEKTQSIKLDEEPEKPVAPKKNSSEQLP